MAVPTAETATPQSPAEVPRRRGSLALTSWRPAPQTVHRLALASLIGNVAIVATGGLVRLTNSGLGCPTWPTCDDDSLVPTHRLSSYKAIEFGNRTLTGVLLIVVAAVFVATVRSYEGGSRQRRWAWVTLLGIPAQALMGGVVTLTNLNPLAVGPHFLLSMLLIAAATILWWHTRASPDDAAPAPDLALRAQDTAAVRAHDTVTRRMATAIWIVTYLVFAVGTVVTGSGPHAGSPKAVRLQLRPAAVSQLHADLVMLLVGLAISLAVYVHATGGSADSKIATRAFVIALAVQAGVGFAQYFSGLPIALVELHVTGAACLAALSTGVVLALGAGAASRSSRVQTVPPISRA